jgi:2-succinyl-5-enolpyruvyl-6-hydroxy-3-cyclohexene-1-carboxylate synthase
MSPQEVLYCYVGALVDELARAGVRNVCVCPGSRSTPLALMVARHPDLRVWMHVDERSAGFFALGMAKARREPVALICTSGTAAANFLPAVVEASLSRVPLVVLTADRPHELRDNGAPQAIDQIRLYGGFTRWFADLALPEADPAMLRYVRATVARAVGTATAAPAGPVHLNCPFREPLVPIAPAEAPPALRAEGSAYISVVAGRREPPAEAAARLRAALDPARRGLIICGPQDDPALPAAVAALAAGLGYPLLADPLSGLRRGPAYGPLTLGAYDAFLRDPAFVAGHAPEVVLRFGAMPVSKAVLLYLQQYPDAVQMVVDPAPGWNEPTNLAAEMIYADPALLCATLTPAAPPAETAWSRDWQDAERRARAVLERKLDGMREPFEGKVFAELGRLLPADATLYVGNSMPVRDLDTFMPAGDRPLRILANRGANGIDGVVSSALGAAGVGGPLALVIGDLSFYHDLNGLLAARAHRLNATIIVLNNDGGGIFSFLPQAEAPDHFEQLFGTPTGLDFAPAVAMYGGRFLRPTTWDAFAAAVTSGLSGDGLTVIEVRTDRAENVAAHRALWPAVSAALRGED